MHLKLAGLLSVALLSALTLPASGQVNVALNKPAFASELPQYSSSIGGPVDGNSNPFYDYSSNFFHSSLYAQAWWYVDLGQEYEISQLTFIYRADCCPEQNDGNLLRVWASAPDFAGNFANPGTALFTAALDYTQSGIFTAGLPVMGRYVSLSTEANFTGVHAIVAAELQVWSPEVVTSTTPEPASLVLMMSGLVAIGGVTRARRRAA